MTGDAIAVDATSQGFGIRRSLLIGISLMLVVMMTEVLCSRPGLMLAIAGHRRPRELERQENEEEDREPAAHGRDCIREIFTGSPPQDAHAVANHQQTRAYIGEDCHPHGRIANIPPTALSEIGAIRPSRGATTHPLWARYIP